MVYYQDIDFTEPIEMVDSNYSWAVIEKRLNDMFDAPGQLFEPLTMGSQSRKRGR